MHADKKSSGSKREKKEKKDKREKKDRDRHKESKKARHHSKDVEPAETNPAEPKARPLDPEMYAAVSQ